MKSTQFKAPENIIKLSAAHLTICNVYKYFWNNLFNFTLGFKQAFYTVMQIKNLTAPLYFPSYSLSNSFICVFINYSFYRLTVLRRCC